MCNKRQKRSPISRWPYLPESVQTVLKADSLTTAVDQCVHELYLLTFKVYHHRKFRSVIRQLATLRAPHCANYSDYGLFADWIDYPDPYDCLCGCGEKVWTMESTILYGDYRLISRPDEMMSQNQCIEVCVTCNTRLLLRCSCAFVLLFSLNQNGQKEQSETQQLTYFYSSVWKSSQSHLDI